MLRDDPHSSSYVILHSMHGRVLKRILQERKKNIPLTTHLISNQIPDSALCATGRYFYLYIIYGVQALSSTNMVQVK